jgi:hypothetical protein
LGNITINNIGYINNIDTILYIYRVHDNIIPNKKIIKKNKKIGRENKKIGKENKIKFYRRKLPKLLKV